MNTITKRQSILEMIVYLRELEDGNDPEDSQSGLCFNLREDFGVWINLPYSETKRWPKWSGCAVYPVSVYDVSNYYKKWDDTQHGEDRRDWCGYVADLFEEYLQSIAHEIS